MKQARKGPKAHTKAAQTQEGPKDRKSTSGISGLPKKGGHGGKFTWSGDVGLADVAVVAAVDSKDPNFEDPVNHDLSP